MSEIPRGVWAASLTPMDEHLNIDTDIYIRHIRNLLAQGCNGIALFGTTGEANSFSVSEKIMVLASVIKAGIDPTRLMVGTGCCAVSDTILFTQKAIDLGFTNFLVLPPFYYKGVSAQGIFNSYAQLIAALPQTGVNIIIYDIPQMSGVEISLELLQRLREAFPNIVKGVKNSTGNWAAIKATCETMPEFAVFAGTEQYLLPTLQAGGAGCISATANVTSQKLGEIYARYKTQDAENLQSIATKTRLILQQYPPAPALKQIMAQTSGRKNWVNIRPPLVNLSADATQNMLRTIDASGLALNEHLSL
ncbi:MAG: dihydrodipicolinate synthase family protein [Robiginitomaculum sp.]|nr:dihydrodipicolinate synthase family protein [Robiginitomaculum sp.]